MKKIFLLATGIAMMFVAKAQLPAPSPTETISQDFGLGKIMITYSRPGIKNRTVFMQNSDLAPLGKLWRTGANAATKITFTDKVTIGGKDLDTGSYVLYTIPGKNQWEIILNKGLKNWGSDGYLESDDVVRFKVPVTETKPFVESFTMQVANVKYQNCELQLSWGTTLVSIPIITNIVDRIRTQIEQSLTQGDKKPYWQAANFYYEWDKNNDKALENVNKAITESPDAFYMYLLRAKIEKAQGKKMQAKNDAQKCKELATAAKNDDYVAQANDFLKGL
ncbi:MAG: DUF2911 domain-containing protein [Chitinophagaceae bacterium]